MSRAACVIVGGGPAGIATALFLAHAAPALVPRIVVLEKERYPRDKFCAGAIGARADRLLESIGVVVDVPSVPIDALALRARSGTTIARESGAGRVVRRIEFDAALAAAARERGIAVRDGMRATAVHFGPDSVTVSTERGDVEADVVVGADGVGSLVRRALGIGRALRTAQVIEVDTESVPSDLPRDTICFDVSRADVAGYYWDFPTVVDGRPLVCRGVYALRSEGTAPDVEDVLRDELRARGLDLERHRKKRFAERGFDRATKASWPRALLVGEAVGIDPVTGEGIAQAVQYGATAGAYLARKLASEDLGFEDWDREIRRGSVGRDLLVRSWLVDVAYGPSRSEIERFLVDTPDFLRVGLEHFAGRRWSGKAVGRAAAGAARAFFSTLVGR